ncbi:MAG: hypothetical protein QG648_346 [Patescibacteria group bacterium]|nr:hypothetical protein [Patescibacteria group bacterium]
MTDEITYIGITNFRNEFERFGIKTDDRRRHMYVIGKAGVGKTTMIENMAIQDILANRGVGIIDPHGELIQKIIHFIPEARIPDVVYFNPSDLEWPIAFNVIEEVPLELRHLVVAGLMAVFKKIWPDVWSARMEYILNNTLLALLEYPGSTLLGVNRMLSDSDFRQAVVSRVTDPVVKSFWEKEFSRYHDRFATEAIAPIQNKVGQFIANPLVRNIIGQKTSKIDLREIMDSKKILLVNVSKGLIGEDNSALLGALLITKLQLAAMSRIDIPEEERQDFYLYIDEFQNFSTESFANIFAEARKYRLDLILAHQYINQLNDTVKDAIFGNIGTLVTFRTGPEDAELLEKYFFPDFTQEDIINLPNYNFYIKLMIDGYLSKGFSGMNIPPSPLPLQSFVQEIIQYSREHYATPRAEVEKQLTHWEFLDFSPQEKTNQVSQTAGIKEGWEATCSNCGKKIIVPFRPDPRRPVYCEDCFKEIKKVSRGEQLRREKPPPRNDEIKKIIKNIFH